MNKAKNMLIAVYITIIMNLISCTHKNKTTINESPYFFEFKVEIMDTIVQHLIKSDTSCDIFISLDRNQIFNIIRLNVWTPNYPNSLRNKCHMITKLNGRKTFLYTGVEDLFIENASIQVKNSESIKTQEDCDLNMFVVYDSAGVITVKDNLNDFDDDLRPSQQFKFKLRRD